MKVENHIYTGRVPESSWNRIANGRCYNSIAVASLVILLVAFVMASCTDNSERKKNIIQKPPPVYTPVPVYEQPIYVPPTTDVTPQREEPFQEQCREETSVVEQQSVQTTVTISKYYEEGYDDGYDDGEDDAVMDNGWGGQFDDSCPYRGKARKEYQLGYEEGYEAGYYDNKDGDE